MTGEAGPLVGKRVVLGVCGGIAAYKAVEVCRRLVDAGAFVSPVLTAGATRFVGAPTFTALASEPVRTSLFEAEGGDAAPHISLGRGADAVVVVPATARLIGSYTAGISSDLLTTTLLATQAPVLLCPAMHTEMWEHPAVQHNISVLRQRGVHILEPEVGRLAGGDVGKGRLPAPEAIVAALIAVLDQPASSLDPSVSSLDQPEPSLDHPESTGRPAPLAGVKAVVSAGGTREPIDPVRYIGNRSSGKQGYAVAAELARRGAQVTLISSSDLGPPSGTDLVGVETAAEMAEAVLQAAVSAQVVVMAAAVADYRPAAADDEKIRKSGNPLVIELVPTVDVLAELGARRAPGQVLVGFAAETAGGGQAGPLAELGRAKLVAKGADIIVANDVGSEAYGFGRDQSSAVIVSRASVTELGLVDKRVVATALVDAIAKLLAHQEGADQ